MQSGMTTNLSRTIEINNIINLKFKRMGKKNSLLWTLALTASASAFAQTDDVTSKYVKNPTFDQNTDGWINVPKQPSAGNSISGLSAESWENTAADNKFDAYQIVKLPKGKYKLSADMFNSLDGIEGTPNTGQAGMYVSIAGQEQGKVVVPTTTGRKETAKNFFVEFKVAEDNTEVRIGFKNFEVMTARWFVFDNVKLEKYELTDAQKQIIEDLNYLSTKLDIEIGKMSKYESSVKADYLMEASKIKNNILDKKAAIEEDYENPSLDGISESIESMAAKAKAANDVKVAEQTAIKDALDKAIADAKAAAGESKINSFGNLVDSKYAEVAAANVAKLEETKDAIARNAEKFGLDSAKKAEYEAAIANIKAIVEKNLADAEAEFKANASEAEQQLAAWNAEAHKDIESRLGKIEAAYNEAVIKLNDVIADAIAESNTYIDTYQDANSALQKVAQTVAKLKAENKENIDGKKYVNGVEGELYKQMSDRINAINIDTEINAPVQKAIDIYTAQEAEKVKADKKVADYNKKLAALDKVVKDANVASEYAAESKAVADNIKALNEAYNAAYEKHNLNVESTDVAALEKSIAAYDAAVAVVKQYVDAKAKIKAYNDNYSKTEAAVKAEVGENFNSLLKVLKDQIDAFDTELEEAWKNRKTDNKVGTVASKINDASTSISSKNSTIINNAKAEKKSKADKDAEVTKVDGRLKAEKALIQSTYALVSSDFDKTIEELETRVEALKKKLADAYTDKAEKAANGWAVRNTNVSTETESISAAINTLDTDVKKAYEDYKWEASEQAHAQAEKRIELAYAEVSTDYSEKLHNAPYTYCNITEFEGLKAAILDLKKGNDEARNDSSCVAQLEKIANEIDNIKAKVADFNTRVDFYSSYETAIAQYNAAKEKIANNCKDDFHDALEFYYGKIGAAFNSIEASKKNMEADLAKDNASKIPSYKQNIANKGSECTDWANKAEANHNAYADQLDQLKKAKLDYSAQSQQLAQILDEEDVNNAWQEKLAKQYARIKPMQVKIDEAYAKGESKSESLDNEIADIINTIGGIYNSALDNYNEWTKQTAEIESLEAELAKAEANIPAGTTSETTYNEVVVAKKTIEAEVASVHSSLESSKEGYTADIVTRVAEQIKKLNSAIDTKSQAIYDAFIAEWNVAQKSYSDNVKFVNSYNSFKHDDYSESVTKYNDQLFEQLQALQNLKSEANAELAKVNKEGGNNFDVEQSYKREVAQIEKNIDAIVSNFKIVTQEQLAIDCYEITDAYTQKCNEASRYVTENYPTVELGNKRQYDDLLDAYNLAADALDMVMDAEYNTALPTIVDDLQAMEAAIDDAIANGLKECAKKEAYNVIKVAKDEIAKKKELSKDFSETVAATYVQDLNEASDVVNKAETGYQHSANLVDEIAAILAPVKRLDLDGIYDSAQEKQKATDAAGRSTYNNLLGSHKEKVRLFENAVNDLVAEGYELDKDGNFTDEALKKAQAAIEDEAKNIEDALKYSWHNGKINAEYNSLAERIEAERVSVDAFRENSNKGKVVLLAEQMPSLEEAYNHAIANMGETYDQAKADAIYNKIDEMKNTFAPALEAYDDAVEAADDKALAEAQKNLAEIAKDYTKYQGDIENLYNDIANIDDELAAYNEMIAAVDATQKAFDEAVAEINELDVKEDVNSSSVGTFIDGIKKSIVASYAKNTAKKDKEDIDKQIADANKQIADLTNEANKLQAAYEANKKATNELNNSLKDLKNAIADAKAEIEALKDEDITGPFSKKLNSINTIAISQAITTASQEKKAAEKQDEIAGTIEAAMQNVASILEGAKEAVANKIVLGNVDLDEANEVDVNDYNTLLAHVLGRITLEGKALQVADVNEDGDINVADVTGVANIINGRPVNFNQKDNSAKVRKAAAKEDLMVSSKGNVIGVSLTNSRSYAGFQMDVKVPAGMEVVPQLTSRTANLSIYSNMLEDGTLRVVVCSLDGGVIAGNSGAVVELVTAGNGGIVEVSNISAASTSAGSYSFPSGAVNMAEATGIESIALQNANGEIYNASGALQNSMQKGLNIIRQAGGAVKKMFVK